MKKSLFYALIWSVVLTTFQQIGAILFSWRAVPLIEAPLVILIFMIALGTQFRIITLTACLTGFLLDLWSGSGFGTIMASLTITVLVSIKIFQHLLTNKSLFAILILGALATLFFRICIFLINSIGFLKEPALIYTTFIEMGLRSIIQIIAHSIVLVLFFLFTRMLSKRFHHHYLRTS